MREDENAIVLGCDSGTRLDMTKSTVGTADQQTQQTQQRGRSATSAPRWPKPAAAASRSKTTTHPGLKTEDGIADIGFAWAAWIIDPRANALGILQVND